MFTLKDVYIDWSPEKDNFTHANQFIFLILPGALLFMLFIFRRKISSIDEKLKRIIYITLGSLMIFGELGFDIAAIANRESNVTLNSQMYKQFTSGFDFCRMNMYIGGTFMILCKPHGVKGVAATSLFGGYSTLIDHYNGRADIHSVMTHTVFLAVFPSVVVTISGENYRIRDLIGAHLFNGLLVAVMYTVNVYTGESAGELTEARMHDNMLAGGAPGPVNMFVGIFAVMTLEGLYFFIFRTIYGRTFLTSKKIGFGKSFALEGPQDKAEGFGFKCGINNFKKEKN